MEFKKNEIPTTARRASFRAENRIRVFTKGDFLDIVAILTRMNKKFLDFIRSQINQIRADGLAVLVRNSRKAFLTMLAVLVIFLVRALRPLVLIRFGRLESRRIGHFLTNTAIYLCERDAGMHGSRTFDIFYHYLPISNFQVKKMWERTGRLNICPFTNFMHALDILNRLFPGGEHHTISMASITTDRYGLLYLSTKGYLSFTPEEELLGREALRKLGIFDNRSFVCFHARDLAYLDAVYPNCNWSWRYQDYRDSNIHNYVSAAQELARRGYFAVRMGAVVKEVIDTQDPMIIDYAIKGRTDFLDIYLGARCRFFICDSAGISSVPIVFRRPIAWVNYPHLQNIPAGGAQDLLIPKKLWLRKERRFLNLREIVDSNIGWFFKVEQFEQLGIELVENTPEEIAALAVEMDERLKGTWQTTEEDEQLQQCFWTIFKSNDLNQLAIQFHPRIGTEFLRQNRKFLE